MSARSRVVVVLVVAVLALVSVAAPLSAKKKPTGPVILTDQQLAAAVLVISDMPSGWSTLPADPESSVPNATGGACGGPNEPARAQNAEVLRSTTAQFTANPQSGPAFYEGIYVFESKKAAKAFVAANRALLTTCPQFQDTIQGLPFSTVVTEVSFPKIGDEVAALRLVSTATDPNLQGTTLSVDQIYIRKDNYVMAVGQSSGSGLAAVPADPNFNQQYSSKALSKLGAAIQKAKQASKKAASK